MPGGLLNLISEGSVNSILTGNPKKTFFSTTYSKYTNFGMQKFRLDYEGLRTLRMTEDSVFTFNVPRHADLLMDTYFVVSLPNIWSPIREFFPPLRTDISDVINAGEINPITRNFWPFEFKWIENLGSQMIRRVRYSVGGTVIQEFTGQYLYNMVQRDFTKAKRELFDEMTGNTKELNDPANYGGRENNYPNAIYNADWLNNNSDTNGLGPEPSIRGRKIYVPLNIWSTLNSKVAFPLVSLQYEELTIEITCRPIQELFLVRFQPSPTLAQNFADLEIRMFTNTDTSNYIEEAELKELIEQTQNIGNYVQPNQVNPYYHMFRFLNPPFSPTPEPDGKVTVFYKNTTGNIHSRDVDVSDNRRANGTITLDNGDDYINKDTDWNSDIHLIANYVFLSDDERNRFAREEQCYLIKEVHETTFFNKTGNNLINLNSLGLVASWMWFFQRSDVNLRNQWSNYSNWDYGNIPYKGITNIIQTYRKDYIPRRFYDQANNFIDSYNPASWDATTLSNFSLYWLRSSDTSSNTDLSNAIARVKGKQVLKNLVAEFSLLPNPYLISGPVHVENQYEIMTNWGLLLNGKYRETNMDSGVLNYVEKYVRTAGNAKRGLYCYNFTLNTDPFVYQPSGAINMSKFNLIQFETSTILPTQRDNVQVNKIKDSCGNIIGINKPVWNLFNYNYNLHVMEERYNILKFTSGMASLVFSR